MDASDVTTLISISENVMMRQKAITNICHNVDVCRSIRLFH
ncbi:5367_t:CDS:1, partial [Scutellospora calospora]